MTMNLREQAEKAAATWADLVKKYRKEKLEGKPLEPILTKITSAYAEWGKAEQALKCDARVE